MTMTTDPVELLLSEADAGRLRRLADRMRVTYHDPDSPRLADHVPLITREMPDDLALFLHQFRLHEPAGAAVIRGWGLDDELLGPTPDRYDPPDPSPESIRWAMYVLALGWQLGRPFAQPHLQKGRRVHNVLPTPGSEQDKTGTSSASVLELHTEDACWTGRARYLLLHCLRNDDKVPTTYASLAMAGLDPHAEAVLFQPRFTMTVEPDHQAKLGRRLIGPVLYGNPAKPRLAYDGFYLAGNDAEARDALAHLTACLEAAATDITLAPGDTAIIANEYATHGRRSFPFHRKGRDRWLQRLHVR